MRGENGSNRDPGFKHRIHGTKKDASFQVIVLGSSGGPREDTITGLLVRAPQSEWRKSSMIAVDAGAHLASIIRVLEQEMPMNSEKIPPDDYSKVLENGPFAGVRFPHISAKANALFIFRELLHSFLITHPHLDHISGMGINTPALEYGREAKAIVALPSTIEAIKSHIFNDAIWPNLSDEGHGVGFVTYRRLIEGGNPRLGYGQSRGYVNVCDGLATKCWGVSHGKCHRRHSISHQRRDSYGFPQNDGYQFPNRRLSRISDDNGYLAAVASQHRENSGAYAPPAPIAPTTPGPAQAPDRDHMFEPVSSSAFFIRNDATGHEILIFGDIEPDSVSISPRNHIVWDDAASKVSKGLLKAIFIECSYDDSVRNEDLYGHLCPRHLIAELAFLANRVIAAKAHKEAGENVDSWDRPTSREIHMQEPPTPSELKKKRKRGINGESSETPEPQPPAFSGTFSPSAYPTKIPAPAFATPSPQMHARDASHSRRKTENGSVPGRDDFFDDHQRATTPVQRLSRTPVPRPQHPSLEVTPTQVGRKTTQQPPARLSEPLKGLCVHVIHVKDTLADGPTPGDIIAGQLKKLGEEAGLGCEFDVTSCGESIWI